MMGYLKILDRQGQQNKEGGTAPYKSGMTDYDQYNMSPREYLFYTAAAALVIYMVGYIFYHSHWLSMLITPAAMLYPKVRTKETIKRRKNNLNLQFRDMIYSLSSSLTAGKSVELAFKDVLKDLEILYPDPATDIIAESEYIVRKIEMNETIETALQDFAGRSHLEDIENFADVFRTCKRTGGNIVEIIRNTSNIISDKIEIKQEIETLLAAKKFEQKVLNVVPIVLMVILSSSAGDYMAPIFSTAAGRIATTVSMALLFTGYMISQSIMNIEV